MPRYSQIVQAPKLAVRRETGAVMIENAKLFDRLLLEKEAQTHRPRRSGAPLRRRRNPNRLDRLQSRMTRGLVQHLNIPICRGKFGIRSLDNPDVISEPFGNLENAYSSRREIAGKAMAHDVRRHPPEILGCHEIRVRASEVPSIAKPPLFHFRPKHPFVSVAKFQKLLSKTMEALRERNGSLLLSFDSNVADLRT